jgi:hypothetical protein
MNDKLNQIISDAWVLWDYAHQKYPRFVPKNSAPILWFGNENAYQNSHVKLVTIGVNPGPLSFPARRPWHLYPKLEAADSRRDSTTYREAMNEYKFDGWFKPFNALLAPLGACYVQPSQHEALHLDLCPIMTTELWSKLPPHIKNDLAQRGVDLLRRLLDYLDPQWIFFSLSKSNFENYAHHQLSLKLGKVNCLQSLSSAKHEVSELTRVKSSAKIFWFKKTGIRPISPSAASLKAFGEFLNNPKKFNPLLECNAVHRATGTKNQVAPRSTLPRANRENINHAGPLTPEQFKILIREVVDSKVSTFSYSHETNRYNFYRFNLMDDQPVKLDRITAERSFVNLIFELHGGVGKAFLEVTPHFTEGWRFQASQEFMKLDLYIEGAKYVRLINFNHLLGQVIEYETQINEWVLSIEEQLNTLLSVDNPMPIQKWSYINNKLGDQWHLLSQLLPIQQ